MDEDLSQILGKAEPTWRLIRMKGTKERGCVPRRLQLRKSFKGGDPATVTKRESRFPDAP